MTTTRDNRGDYAVRCDVCQDHHSTPQPTRTAARSAAEYSGWIVTDGRDVCPWCKSEDLLAEYWVETGR